MGYGFEQKETLHIFYRGRTGSGASYNFAREELDDSMQLVVIKGSDFQTLLRGRSVYTRLRDRAIASPYGYEGPVRIYQVSLREDRAKLDDRHLNDQIIRPDSK